MRLRDLPVEKTVRRRLRDEGIRSSEDLWRAVSTEFASGLEGLRARTQLDLDGLLAVFGAGIVETPRRRPSLEETLVGLVWLAIAILVVVRLGEAFDIVRFPVRALSAEMDQVVVMRKGGLPAFHVLESSDLGLVRRHRAEDGFGRLSEVIGRYLLRPVAGDRTLRHGEVSSTGVPSVAIGERWIVIVSVAVSTVGPQTAPGSEVSLILSPKEGSARPAVEVRALLLALERGASAATATLAIGRERTAEVAAVLGSSVIYLATAPGVQDRTRPELKPGAAHFSHS